MYRKNKPANTGFEVNTSYEAESLEKQIERMMRNNEPIKDTVPLNYTDRSEGVRADMDIRTDRFEIAAETMDKAAKGHIARRQERHKKNETTATEGTQSQEKNVGGDKTTTTGNEGSKGRESKA